MWLEGEWWAVMCREQVIKGVAKLGEEFGFH